MGLTSLQKLLNSLATMITAFFKNDNDAGSFVSCYKDSYNTKPNVMNTISETHGYLIRQNKGAIQNDASAMNASVALYSNYHLLTFKNAVMKTWILKSAVLAITLLISSLFFVSSSFAQITQPTAWTKAYDQSGATGTGISFPIANGSNRILVVGISTSYTAAGGSGTQADPTTISYGGATLTKATTNATTSARMHTWIYYLKENAVMNNTSRPLNVTVGAVSGSTQANMTVWYAVYAGVDQSGTITTGNNITTSDATTAVQLSANMAIDKDDQAVYISSVFNPNNSTLPSYTLNANWNTGAGTNTGTNTSGGNTAWRVHVANRAIPSSNVNDNAATSTISPTGRYAISAISLPRFCAAPSITGTLSVCAGSTTQLTGAGSPAASNPWVSATTSVATVNSSGLVSGVAAGTSVITYTNDIGCSNTATVTVSALPTITKGANPTVCQGSTSANISYSALGNGANQYSIDYSAGDEAQGFVDVVNATLAAAPSNIVMVVPAGAASGAHNATLTVRNSTTGCVSAGQAIAVTLTARPTVSLGANPSVCRGTTSALISYSVTNSPNQYSIVYDATALAAGFVNVTNATLSGGNINIVIPALAPADLYNATVTVRNSTTTCVSTVSNITVEVKAPGVSFTGPTTICVGATTTLSPTEGGTWVSNTPLRASVDNEGNVTGLSGGAVTFTFTETATGCSSTTGSITVQDHSTLALSSLPATAAQTACIGANITNIVYQVGGGGTGATVTGLPAGLITTYAPGPKTFTISGAATEAGSFSYTVTTTGLCDNVSLGGTIDITEASSINITSGVGTNAQTKCINNAITDITYAMGGNSTGISMTAGSLPAGVTGSFDAGTYTISGTPTASGSFSYTLTTAGPCPRTATGTITVTADATLVLQTGSANQTRCPGAAITTTTYVVGGSGTSITVTGLPTGINGSYNGGTKTLTISGNSSVVGTHNFTVNSVGPCVTPSLTGTITINANSTISLTSAGANIQTRCTNTPITDITYAIGGGGTGANVTGLPAGLTTSFNAGVFTISGTATASGVFAYTITTTGPCTNPNLTGTLTINAIPVTSSTPFCQDGSGTLNSSTTCASGAPVTTAATNATTGSNVTGVGTIAWTSTSNVVSDNNSYATLSMGSATSNYLNATGYNFAIPANAVISGIQLTIGRFSNNANTRIQDNQVRLLKAGVLTGNNKAVTGSNWPQSETALTYGSTSDLWGATWTAADINNANFGSALSVLNATGINATYPASVDYMQIRVTYTVPGSLNWYTAQSGGFNLGSGTGFNPVGVLNSPLANTNTPGTTVFWAECSTVQGCRTPTDFVIKANPVVSITGSTSICLDASTTLSPTSGGTWVAIGAAATVSNDGTVTPIAPGTATFKFTDAVTGCDKTTAAVTVLANSSITLSSVAGTDAQTKCINTAITNITYAIGGGGTGASITAGSLPAGVSGSYNAGVFTISGTATEAGSFSYTVTTSGPCINNEMSGTITINPAAAISLTSASGTDVQFVCNNSAITDITYAVSGGGTGAGVSGLPAGVTAVFNAGVFTISGTPTVTGTFNYTVTTTGTCAQTAATGTITVRSLPTALYTRTNVSACNSSVDGTITLAAPTGGTGPYTYSWTGNTTPGGHVPFTAGDVSSLTGLDIGFYNVAITDAFGCVGNVTGIHLQYAFSAFVTNNGSISSACGNTGSIILYANAGVQPYTFSLDGTNYGSNNLFTGLAAGLYTAYVKDGAGCVITKDITVAAAPQIVVNPFVRPASSCSNDGSIEIYRTGGIPPYQYSKDGTNYQSSNTYTGLSAGPYTVYVKDSKGCIGQATVSVTQGATLGLSFSRVNTSSCVNDGSIQVTPIGGTAPYQYKIGAGSFQSSNAFGGLAAGPYAIQVMDSKGCTGSVNVTINISMINVNAYTAAASNCATSNGVIQLFRNGGTGPFTYSINGDDYFTSNVFNGVAPGIYTGFVKDSKFCIGTLGSIVIGPEDCGGGSRTASKGTVVPAKTNNSPVISAVKVAANSVLKIKAYPNPSTEGFTLALEGGNNTKVVISVTDILGRKVYQVDGDVKNQYRFGNNFKTGIYILQITQGNDKQSIKLIKE